MITAVLTGAPASPLSVFVLGLIIFRCLSAICSGALSQNANTTLPEIDVQKGNVRDAPGRIDPDTVGKSES